MNHLGQLLKEQRLANNLSMKSVYKATGIHDSTLSRIENGEMSEPPAKTIRKLSNLYGSDIVPLFVSCGYLQVSDLEKYQQCFSGVDKLTEEEKSFIQTQIDLFLKNKRGDENDI